MCSALASAIEFGVDHHHAAPGGGVDVDVVDADARPAHDDELVTGLEYVGRDPGRAAHDQGLRAAYGIEQLVGIEPEPHVDLEAGAAQCLEAALGQLLGDEDPRHGVEARRHRYVPQTVSVAEELRDPLDALDEVVVAEGEREAGVAGAPNASPGTMATLASSSSTSQNSSDVAGVRPPRSRGRARRTGSGRRRPRGEGIRRPGWRPASRASAAPRAVRISVTASRSPLTAAARRAGQRCSRSTSGATGG